MKSSRDVCIAERQLPRTKTILSGCDVKRPEKGCTTF
jgi:hypothetical protein